MRAARKLLSVLKDAKLMTFASSALVGRETCCNFLKPYERDDSSHLLMFTKHQQKDLIGSMSVHCGGLNSEMRHQMEDLSDTLSLVTYQFNFICTACLTMDVVTKQLYIPGL